jgi:hypothetical protein
MESNNLNSDVFHFFVLILFSLWAYGFGVFGFVFAIKDKKILDCFKDNYLAIHHFINKKLQKENDDSLKILDNEQNEEKTEEQKQQEQEQIKYENKFLEEIRKMPKEYILTDDEIEIKSKKYTEYYDEIIKEYTDQINNYVIKIFKLSREIEHIENIENVKEKKYTDDDGTEYIVDSDGEEYAVRTEEDYKTEIDDLQKNIDKLCNEKNNKAEIQEKAENLSQNYIIEQRLEKLKNCFVMEKTPLGNVLMIYKDGAFEYYSDNSMPYRYLETVARKYIKMFNCRQIYIDMEEELKMYEEKLNKNTEINQTDKKINNTKKNVFAKFKSYNKDALTGRVNMVPPPKNNISNNLIPNENVNDKVILKENANHYKYQGKLSNFNILKKVDRKIVDKKYGMSFSDFKKTTMYQKIKN